MKQPYSLFTTVLSSQLANWRGAFARAKATKQPEKLLELYEFEPSPFCRIVREALTEMDLDAVIFPCPKGGTRFRPVVEKLGGKQQFPYLHDPNTGKYLYESDAIIDYLAETYGSKLRAKKGFARQAQVVSALAASVARLTPRVQKPKLAERVAGLNPVPSILPEQYLELYSFEASPYSRPVRELLCEMEIPYILRSFGKDKFKDIGPAWVRLKFGAPVTGRNRNVMSDATGRTQVPYLRDPNTGVDLFESKKILAYLREKYGK